ncbi:MAG: type A chloramphenicol O-acetyltransferase [Anaerovoracaceae bacterium]
MAFNKIDISTWNRKESYSLYYTDVPCTYSMTVNLDITTLLTSTESANIKFFPSILFALSSIVNKHKEFRMDLDEDGNTGYYDISNPCFTVFHNETETFTNVWTEYAPTFDEFLKNYTMDMDKYHGDCVNSKPLTDRNVFNVSAIPWSKFTGFNLNLQKGYDYFPPIFTFGKYFDHGKKTLLPLAIQVHHAVCDGFHVSRFVNDLQKFIDSFEI